MIGLVLVLLVGVVVLDLLLERARWQLDEHVRRRDEREAHARLMVELRRHEGGEP